MKDQKYMEMQLNCEHQYLLTDFILNVAPVLNELIISWLITSILLGELTK